jgi:hypothetical protein
MRRGSMPSIRTKVHTATNSSVSRTLAFVGDSSFSADSFKLSVYNRQRTISLCNG